MWRTRPGHWRMQAGATPCSSRGKQDMHFWAMSAALVEVDALVRTGFGAEPVAVTALFVDENDAVLFALVDRRRAGRLRHRPAPNSSCRSAAGRSSRSWDRRRRPCPRPSSDPRTEPRRLLARAEGDGLVAAAAEDPLVVEVPRFAPETLGDGKRSGDGARRWRRSRRRS